MNTVKKSRLFTAFLCFECRLGLCHVLTVQLGPQSRQRVLGLFSSLLNLDPPPLHPQASVSPPLVPGASEEGTDTVGLFRYTYMHFVARPHPKTDFPEPSV